MPFESDLATWLIAEARAVHAHAGTRIHPTRKPPAALRPATYPCVTFWLVTGSPVHSIDGTAGLRIKRFQLNCWAKTYKAARQLADALKEDLDNFRGTMGDTRVGAVLLEDEADVSDPRLGVDADTPFGVRLDFRVIHAP